MSWKTRAITWRMIKLHKLTAVIPAQSLPREDGAGIQPANNQYA